MNINYTQINARAFNLLISVKKHVLSIDSKLKAIIELRVSQINGCAYCIDLHSNEARIAGEDQQRLDCLPTWRECQLFSDKEMAALKWAESITLISQQVDIEEKLTNTLNYFSETEIVDLTLIISVMNSLNRMAISFGDKPVPRA